MLLHRHIWDCGVEDDGYPKKQDYIDELLSIQDINTMKKWCKERIHYLTRAISGLKEKRISNAVLRAKEYIDKNFHLDITLEDVSKDICISPHYLSRLFKEEMGENFIDYLTNVRINKAKEYLKEGLFSVKEICYEVGYGDPSYFCRIFKKVVGTTPTEYKELSYLLSLN